MNLQRTDTGVRRSLTRNSPERLRVLYVAARYFPYTGGTETHTFEVARRMALLGHSVSVLTTDPRGECPPRETSEGVNIHRVRAWPRRRDFYLAPQVYTIVRGFDGDLVHCQGYHTLVGPLAMLAAQRQHIPYLVTFHSGGHSSRLRVAIRGAQVAALSPLLREAECLLAVSEFEAELFRRRIGLPPGRIEVIPNGSDLPLVPSGELNPSADQVIVAVGRLERYKGQHRIIEAMPTILARRPGVQLRIVGAGPEEQALRRLAAKLEVCQQVEFHVIDAKDRAGMARVFTSASLVVLLSEYEANPVAVMEALSLGRPVLVTYTSGLAELADRGLVRAVPMESCSRTIADAVLANLLDPLPAADLRLPSWEETVANLLRVYHRMPRRHP